jgi:hypothetical protein
MTQLEHHDEEDVPAILARETGDGPGDLQNLPEPDFISFTDPDAEVSE